MSLSAMKIADVSIIQQLLQIFYNILYVRHYFEIIVVLDLPLRLLS